MTIAHPYRAILAGAALVFAVSASSPGHTQAASDAQTFQVVSNINGELALLHEANGSAPEKVKNAPAIATKLPRHTLNKAREIFLKVQDLRKVNGLSATTIPAFPGKEATASDVKELTDAILKDVATLRSKFAVTKPSPAAGLDAKKTSQDVYAELEKAVHSLDGLGIPHISPNQVLQVADTIVVDLALIRAKRGLPKVANAAATKGVKPKAVYKLAYVLLQNLKSVTEQNPELKIPGGVLLPNQQAKGRITGNQVIDNLGNIMAEVGAIKAKVGVSEPSKLAPMKAGKKPSDVYDAINTALAMVKTLK